MAPTFCGIGQLVQHDDDAAGGLGDVLQRHALQRLDLEGQALVHRAGRQHPVQRLDLDDLDLVSIGQLVAPPVSAARSAVTSRRPMPLRAGLARAAMTG
jgi:hypothetical protein